jgi:hypothetical protein
MSIYRYDCREVRASDPLPTADTICLAKLFAARACGQKAADTMWQSRERAMNWVANTPIVALAVLCALCPEVSPQRLAVCLRLDPVADVARLHKSAVRPCWSAEMIEAIRRDILGSDA